MNLYVITHGHTGRCATTKQPELLFARLVKNKALIMRVSLLAIMLTMSGLMMANSTDGQDLNKIYVSIDLKNATLKSALRQIEAQSKLPFTYKTVDVARYDKINYQGTDVPVAKLVPLLMPKTCTEALGTGSPAELVSLPFILPSNCGAGGAVTGCWLSDNSK